MVLNSCEASENTFEHEQIDQLDQENWNKEMGQMETGTDEPYVGQVFSSVDEAKRFYNVYAFKTGFSIRKATHYKAKRLEGLVTSTTYTCSKKGHAKPPSQNKEAKRVSENNRTPQKEFPNRRTDCKALMRLRMIEDAKWIVVTFHKEHNHELIVSPSKTHFFRSHRSITNEQKEVINVLSEQNISTSQIMSFMTTRDGEMQNIHFTRKDLSNTIVEKNRSLNGIDVASVLNYFRELQVSDPSFFYAIDVDEEHTTRNLFWVDGRSRMAYQYFSDVVSFDTTYKTNKYCMPFATFVGVNHHKQSIFFGCALLRDETANTFCWLFKTWLKAMFDRHSGAIITDQDPAIRKAIEHIFPNTIHRCCQWHIMRKAREHLGVLYSSKTGFKDELHSCINDSLTIEEFESGWKSMLQNYNLHDNNYLHVLWKSRDQWAPVYFRDTFFANMSTSQRSEGMNALLKILLDSHTSIYKFVIQFEKIVASRYENENLQEFKMKDGQATLWTFNHIEEQARDVYTKNIFMDFRDQLKASTGYRLIQMENNTYKIFTIQNPSKPHQRMYSYVVSVHEDDEKVSCDCKMFNYAGVTPRGSFANTF